MVALINTDVVAWTRGGQTGAQGEEMETMSVQISFQTLRQSGRALPQARGHNGGHTLEIIDER